MNAAGTFANAATFSKGVVIPEVVFAAFQATFAGITCALIVGAFAERIKFSAVMLFMVLWFTFSYLPIAHMVWFWAGPDAYTSKDVVDKVHAATTKALQDPAVRKRIEDTGSIVIANTPQQFADQIKAEYDVYKKVVDSAKLKLD